jgi:hypothetical protein
MATPKKSIEGSAEQGGQGASEPAHPREERDQGCKDVGGEKEAKGPEGRKADGRRSDDRRRAPARAFVDGPADGVGVRSISCPGIRHQMDLAAPIVAGQLR